MIHSDLFLDNTIFSDDNLKGFIDFECVCYGPIVFEVAVGILGCCYEGQSLRIDLMQALLQSYHEIFALNQSEIACLPQYFYFALLFYSYWRFNEFNVVSPNHPDADAYLVHWNRLLDFNSKIDYFKSALDTVF